MTPSDWERAISTQTCRAERAEADLVDMRRLASNATLRADVAEEKLASAMLHIEVLSGRVTTSASTAKKSDT